MDARLLRAATLAACLLSLGASYRTENFLVTSPSAQLSQEVAEAAETYRRELSLEWLGRELTSWSEPCPITVHVGRNLGAGGATSFMFDRGRPFGWTMNIQGSRERILDSVLPHEITHTILATHFGRPLPRWADEGACTTVEHPSEKDKQKRLLIEFLTTGRGIAFNRMFAMKEYPPDVLPLYAQGFSLARFLIAQGGKRQFVEYVGDGMNWNNWTQATRTHYGFKNLSELQLSWLDWVRRGYPPIEPPAPQVAATRNAAADSLRADPSSAADAAELVSYDASGRTGDGMGAARPAVAQPAVETPPAETGWYARARDRAAASRTEVAGKSRPSSAASSPNHRTLTPSGQSVTRPQPRGRPKQTVLEWSSPPRAASHPRAGSTGTPQTYLIGPDALRQRLLR